MKIVFFGTRKEEKPLIKMWAEKYEYKAEIRTDFLTEENACEVKGYDAVCIVVNCRITETAAKALAASGIKYILTRAAGTDHLDVEAIHRYGIRSANVPVYSPNAVSEHTILLTLAVLRHLKEQINRTAKHDFTIAGIQGRELGNMTVGVIGTGRIGCATIRILNGFGSRLLAYDKREKEEMKQLVTYAGLTELTRTSDIIIFHCPVTKENYHMADAGFLQNCKDGVVLVNCARGELLDGGAVLEAVKSGKVGALAIDVFENEQEYLRKDKSGDGMQDKVLEELIGRPEVIYTPHTAFYTGEAIANMVETSFRNLYEYETTGRCKNETEEEK